jgi:hypothetical protein
MPGQWKEVARLRFRGERFRDHALDLSAVTELRQFQEIVVETAKALWHASNPDRKNLPAHFEERTRICFRSIEDGSATVPMEVYLEHSQQRELWEREPVEVNEAIELTYRVLKCAGGRGEIPSALPKRLVPQFMEWGKTLGDADEIELQPPDGRAPVRVNRAVRERLASFAEQPQSTVVDLTGECLEADVRHRRFQIWVDPQTAVQASFDAAHEELVTSALKEHHAVRIRVRGAADISPQGKPLRFTNIESIELVAVREQEFDLRAPAVEEELSAIWADVPAAEWARLPADLTDNLDEYLYGAAE